jgi:hypothetical protein
MITPKTETSSITVADHHDVALGQPVVAYRATCNGRRHLAKIATMSEIQTRAPHGASVQAKALRSIDYHDAEELGTEGVDEVKERLSWSIPSAIAPAPGRGTAQRLGEKEDDLNLFAA